MRREINFNRTVTTIRQKLSELFLREKNPTLDLSLHRHKCLIHRNLY